MSLADQQWSPTSVQVTVLQARGLRIKGKSGTNDAYAVMQVGKEKYQTSVVEKSVAPAWKEEASFDLPPLLLQAGGGGGKDRSTLHVQVLHRALVGPDKLLGQAVINLLQLSEDKTRNKTEWFKLLDKTGKPDKDRGEVLLDVQFMRNNMTASMFDLSAAGKSRSRLGKLKDKVRGKKKEQDSSSGVVPSPTQVLTDSEEEDASGGGEGGKSKQNKRMSLFSPKSNLQKNLSQSMSVLPAKNSSLSGSQSSGLNVDPSEGKKKFKFKIHKHSSSSDSKDSSSAQQKQEQSNLCINGSHVYCEEPPPRTARAGSSFSLSSSGHGSMEDVPENPSPSVDSLKAVREYSPWMEEEEEEKEEEDENINDLRKEEEEKVKLEKDMREEEEEAIRKQQKELERLAEETFRREEEEKVRKEEEERQKLAEEKRRVEEQEKRHREEEKRIKEEERAQERRRQEEEHKLAEEKRRLKEEEERRIEEEKVRREQERAEEERRKTEQEKKRREEEEMLRKEKMRIEEEKEKVRREKEEARLMEEKRREEERIEAEEKFRKEEEERIKMEEEMRRKEREEKLAKRKELEEQERRAREEQEKMQREEEERRKQEEKLAKEKLRQEEERRKAKEERARREEEDRIQKEKIRREEEERKKKEEEEECKIRQEELEKLAIEKMRKEEEERRKAEEERAKREEEQQIQKEKIRREEEEKAEKQRLEDEMRQAKRKEEERMKEEQAKMLKEEKRKRAEDERIKAEKQREEELEKMRVEEERIRREERNEKERREEEIRKQEKLAKEKKENKIKEEEKSVGTKIKMGVPVEIISTNPFDENFTLPEETPKLSKAKSDDQRSQSAASSVESGAASTSEKDPTNIQREKRAAPKPPGRNQLERQKQKEEEMSTQHLPQINKQSKDKDVKTVSVAPQRSVQMIAPLNRSSKDLRNTQSTTEHDSAQEETGKHNKRPAPSIPCTAEDELHRGVVEIKDGAVYGLNPFEDDDEEENELTVHNDATTFVTTNPAVWPPVKSQAADKDSAKVKSSKIARAPLPPDPNDTPSSAIVNRNHGETDLLDDIGETAPNKACNTQQEVKSHVQVQENPNKESKKIVTMAGAREEGPPAVSRRLQPVKPLNPLEQPSDSVGKVGNDNKATELDCNGVQDKTNVGTRRSGPYSQLTREELIALLLKQESQLSERDKKISELEQYIDNLLVRVMEENPSILMSMSSLKKSA
ncbi:rab11 family-interacting protein 1 [Xiphophorus couchianus]|uniref:rab11 family-interacting protein 1 n=1 Tax=Xiphophorus couchianus TaxID=32473 RepID=UPI001016B61A|nr:rab11 family-interacting protein 1-like [Xiphophorus couchianus]